MYQVQLLVHVYICPFFSCSCFFIGLSFCCLFCYHVFYLAFVHFDYGYNMKFNVAIGELGWCELRDKILWSYKNKHEKKKVSLRRNLKPGCIQKNCHCSQKCSITENCRLDKFQTLRDEETRIFFYSLPETLFVLQKNLRLQEGIGKVFETARPNLKDELALLPTVLHCNEAHGMKIYILRCKIRAEGKRTIG